MIFPEPIPFEEALQHQQVKRVLATDAKAADLKKYLAPEIRERAFFSARVTDTRFLNEAHGMITQLASPETIVDPETGKRRPAGPGESVNPAKIRGELKHYLRSIGYTPEPGKEGSLEDLSSDRRLNLIVSTQETMAAGYGNHVQGQTEGVLAMWPAEELYRSESRRERRLWGQRWNDARRALGSRTAAKPVDAPTGHADSGMYAPKNDPIWSQVSEFGLPYPPFDYNSGMRKRDVERDVAVELGIIQEHETPAPDKRPFNEDVKASYPDDMPRDLLTALIRSLGDVADVDEAAKTITLKAV